MKYLKTTIDKKSVLIIIFSLACSVFLFPNYFEATLYPIQDSPSELWKSLDPSWMIALNYAIINKLEWGKDIIFTYGPLSYLSTRVGWGQNKFSFLIYDFFFFINYFAIIYFSFKKSKSIILPFITVCLMLLTIPLWLGSSNAFILLAFLVFWIRMSIETPKSIFFLFQILLLSLTFFVKFNTGLIIIPLYYLGIFYQIYTHPKEYRKFILFGIIPVFAIYLLSILLKVSLLSYVISGLELISGYNDVMYYEHDFNNKILAIVIFLLIISFYAIKLFKEKKVNFIKNVTCISLIGIPLFVLYKQAFVRGMEIDYFLLVPFLILVSQDIYQQKAKAFPTILLICSLSITVYHISNIDKSVFDIKSKFEMHYFEGFSNFTNESGLYLFPNKNQLPANIINTIRDNTVDAYPWNIQMLFENKLNYHPRPVIQSYTSYTPYLEDRNFEFYNSNSGPEFVIYDFASIDYRYAYFDEMKLQLAFKYNYKHVNYFEYQGRKLILLQRKKNFKPISFVKEKEYAILTNHQFIPKEGVYYEFDIYNSLRGKIYSVFKHAPEIEIEIYGKNNYPYPFRTSKNLMKIGLYSNNFFSNIDGYNSYLSNNINPNIEKIKSYIFKPTNESLFKDKIKVTEYKITQ